ncbi:hypothetical protein, partial [Aeromonas salmonicida]
PVSLTPVGDTYRQVRQQIGTTVGAKPNIVTPLRPVAVRNNNTTKIHAPINIIQQPGQSGADVAQEVSRELDKRERQAAARNRATLGDRN